MTLFRVISLVDSNVERDVVPLKNPIPIGHRGHATKRRETSNKPLSDKDRSQSSSEASNGTTIVLYCDAVALIAITIDPSRLASIDPSLFFPC